MIAAILSCWALLLGLALLMLGNGLQGTLLGNVADGRRRDHVKPDDDRVKGLRHYVTLE